VPGITGVLDDNAVELVSQLLGNLADLPFNAFFVDGVDISLPVAVVSRPSAFMVTGTPWPGVLGTTWPQVQGRGWHAIQGSPWRDVWRTR
jgi:hypothetical protein